MKRFSIWILVLLVMGSLVGCEASLRTLWSVESRDAAGKRFIPPTQGASIYVYRDQAYEGTQKLTIAVDEDSLARTVGQCYFVANVPAGRHILAARGEREFILEVEAEEGKIHFVQVEVFLGVEVVKAKLKRVDDTTGREGVLSCRRIELE